MNNWQAEARRLVRERLAAEPGRVAALWAEVEAEAWQEVRAVVKAAMVEALLEELGGGETRRQGDRETRGRAWRSIIGGSRSINAYWWSIAGRFSDRWRHQFEASPRDDT